MKVILSLKELHHASATRGIGVYARELAPALKHAFPRDQFIATTAPPASLRADLLHFPYFDPFARSLRYPRHIPCIVTIHDLIPLRFPDHFPVGLKGRFNWFWQSRAARRVDHILTDSLSSQQDIVKFLGIDPSRISVVPLGPNNTPRVPARLIPKIAAEYHLPDRYLLYVGDINWNKNVPSLINAFAQLSDPKLHLVLVGKVFSDKPAIPEFHSVTTAIAQSGRADRIHLVGFVPSHHLSVFYSRATLYVQPSWYEGFGLPILEAMKFGAPVASSKLGSLPEVGGDAVAYFDPATDMVEVINSLLRSPARRAELVTAGLARAKEFTWERTAALTHTVYAQVLSARS